MFYVKFFGKDFFTRNISIWIQWLVSVILQLLVKPVSDDIIPVRIGNAEVFLQHFFYCFMLFVSIIYSLAQLLTFRSAFLQFAGKLYPYLVRPAVFINHSIDNVDHLIQNLFDHRIPQAVLRQYFEMLFEYFRFNLLLRQWFFWMIIPGICTCKTILIALFHKSEYSFHCLCAQAAIVWRKGDICKNFCIFRFKACDFRYLGNKLFIAWNGFVTLVGVQEMP